MKKLTILAIITLLAACSSPDPELIQYCDYYKASNEISRQANLQFPNSQQALTIEEMKMPEHKAAWEERSKWIAKKHQELRAEYGITDEFAFEKMGGDKGWNPLTCKEQGLW